MGVIGQALIREVGMSPGHKAGNGDEDQGFQLGALLTDVILSPQSWIRS